MNVDLLEYGLGILVVAVFAAFVALGQVNVWVAGTVAGVLVVALFLSSHKWFWLTTLIFVAIFEFMGVSWL